VVPVSIAEEIVTGTRGKAVKTKAIAYLRTSSSANVGGDKDSGKRQTAAITAYAKRANLEIVEWFNDPAVSGADPIETRPGFSSLLDRTEGNGVRIVIIEDASRFARDLVTQELGVLALIKREVRVLTASGDDLTDNSDPSRTMMRQIAGAFAQYEKARIVAKLKAARDRKRAETGMKVGGRKSYSEDRPDVVRLAHKLSRRRPKGQPLSLRQISAALANAGHVSNKGVPYAATAVQRMLQQRA
jgi:DNA invertase Pin-like site-specific DNA recombinase